MKEKTSVPKAVTAGIVAAGIGLSLAACSPAAESSSAGNDGKRLDVWTRSDEVAAANYKAVFDAFTEATGIQVNYVPDPDLNNRLQIAAAAGDLPDVVINDGASLGSYQSRGLLTSVSPQALDESGAVSEEVWASTKGLDGTNYAVPYSRHMIGAGIRTDWLSALGLEEPKTLEDFVEVAKAFTSKDPDGNGANDTAGWAAPLTAEAGYAAWWTAPFIWSAGGDFVTDNGDGTFTSAITKAETIAGIEAARSVVCANPAAIQPSAITDTTGKAAELFYGGGAGIYSFGPWQTKTLDKNVGEGKWTVITPPSGSAGTAALAEGENVYLMAGSEATDAQAEFAKFLISEEGQKLGMTAGTVPSVRLSVNSALDAGTVRQDDRWAAVQSIYDESGRAFPTKIDFASIRSAAGETFNAIYASCGNDNVKSELSKLDQVLTQSLKDQGVAR